ncbi:tetratricopeptide repeat protein [Magnetospirillum fulvum]|uniref:Type 11 methyltransferase n=1 Tax=Magnetospirillum fulvum MGU-K5 TaxID=1316936 RepID=S9SD41_MAGFU|nr:tetratricopeptide repeat protein [Magnetospirillum fulvum]EPY01993.1 type 11 methyltransferase [Magnetospirillum fulvum MGU-K5]
MNRKQRRADKATKTGTPGTAAEPSGLQPILLEAFRHHQEGRLGEAERLYRRILALDPRHADSLHLLGMVAFQSGQPEAAAELIAQAVAVNPNNAMYCSNLGSVLKELGRHDEAVASWRRALTLRPDHAESYSNLGYVLREQGRLDEAADLLRQALAINPGLAEAQCNLAHVLSDLGRFDEAIQACLRALALKEMGPTKRLFVYCLGRGGTVPTDRAAQAAMQAAVLRAFAEPWDRTSAVMRAALTLVKANPEIGSAQARFGDGGSHRVVSAGFLASTDFAATIADPVLRAALTAAPIPDSGLERLLTVARHALLDTAVAAVEPAPGLSDFHAALARQCFINEYVYDLTDSETEQVDHLARSLATALDSGAPVPPAWVVAVASYRPLHSLPGAARLLERSWPGPVEAVLTQQCREPEQERHLRATIPRLTAIESEVSRRVQAQYEQNPYPRWIVAAPPETARPVDAVLRKLFPLAPILPFAPAHGPGCDVLVAGCGTGQQSIESAQSYAGARVLAVDLSLSSLSYAKRKSLALGLGAIEYAQADILALPALGRSFDVIDSSGVLHHLSDPVQAWTILLSLLRPGGFMRVGFYSETARRGLAFARALIAERGYPATADGIRRCRQEILDAGPSSPLAQAAQFSDFFTTSECRDLIFHVEEHCLTLETIAAVLDKTKMRFLGFDIDATTLQAYRSRFPDDWAATDLGQWSRFEADHPLTFVGMYQFWIQKPG